MLLHGDPFSEASLMSIAFDNDILQKIQHSVNATFHQARLIIYHQSMREEAMYLKKVLVVTLLSVLALVFQCFSAVAKQYTVGGKTLRNKN